MKHLQFLYPRTLAMLTSETPIKGVFLHGGVGRGKTMLMDLFYGTVPPIKKLRVHFHSFMLEIHSRLHSLNQMYRVKLRHKDPVAMVALQLSRDCKLICIDEVEVTDIADAMILLRLFSALLPSGVCVVCTSNSHPQSLYKGGLNAHLFDPFAPLLQKHCDTLNLDGVVDYRNGHQKLNLFFHGQSEAAMEAAWKSIIGEEDVSRREVGVMMNRVLAVERSAGHAARFSFEELCGGSLGAADYIALSEAFEIVFIEGIPFLGDAASEDLARRFITLVDVLYESNKVMFCSFGVDPERLFDFHPNSNQQNAAQGPESALDEELTPVTRILDEGGSSGRSTTMIGEMEWSATGRAGASLAKFGANEYCSFTKLASRRVLSRLQEMQSGPYLLRNPSVGEKVFDLLTKP